MKKIKLLVLSIALIAASGAANNAQAQIKLEDVVGQVNIEDLLGQTKLLKVKKGFSPVFSLGNYQVNTVGILGEKLKGINILGDILGKKQVEDIMKMYRTYRTGLVVYKILSSAGTVVAVAGAVKGFSKENGFNTQTVKVMLYPALTSIASGVVTKLITKKASYKAVDVFNGVARKKLKDILSVAPASSTLGLGVYVKL